MILLFGFGGVGRTYAELLYERTELRLCAVFDSGGGVAKKDGFSSDEVRQLLKTPRGAAARSGVGRAAAPDEALDICQVVVDVSPPNYETAEPALSLYKRAFSRGLAVVTANKAPLALAFRELAHRRLFYKATVMAGTPLVDLLMGLPPQKALRVRGILNGSTNYIMTRVYKDGVPFEKAVEEVGAGVSGLRPGDAVAGMMFEYCGECEYCRSGREYLCRNRKIYGEDLPGAFAEYISADPKSLVKIPPGVSFKAASFAACVLSTVVRGVRKIGVKPGMRVLVYRSNYPRKSVPAGKSL